MNFSLEMTIGILVVVLIAFGIAVFFMFKNGERKKALIVVKALVDEAEERFGSGTGPIKYKYVVERTQAILPPIVKFFVTREALDNLITVAVDELQERLSIEIQKETKKETV